VTAGAARTDPHEAVEPDEPGLPVVGEVVAGKYLIERKLGSGGMGIVVAARNILLDDPVAIKFLRPSAAKDDESVHRFVREAKSARRIQSEHVVRVQDVSYLEIGSPYMIMELLEGEDLGQLVDARGVLSVTTAVDYIVEACSGIAEAHALGIVHRDIKPANMFLARRNDGTRLVKVLDFGISKAMEDAAHNPNMTDTRATFGSPTYMSPEQIRSAKRVDFRTDIWSLGVCLHEVLTSRPPFLAETVAGLLASIIADPPVPIRLERPDVPEDLEAIILRCLEKDLSRRFQTIGDLVTALRPHASLSSEGSISRVLRLSPPSYPGGNPSSSDSYPIVRGPTSSVSSMRVSSVPSVASVRSAPPSSLVPSMSSMSPSAHARTEQSFNTSSSIVAPPLARAAAPRRMGVVVAATLGLLSVAALGAAGLTALRHRANASGEVVPVAARPEQVTATPAPVAPPTAPSTMPAAPPTAAAPAVPVDTTPAPSAAPQPTGPTVPTGPTAQAAPNVPARAPAVPARGKSTVPRGAPATPPRGVAGAPAPAAAPASSAAAKDGALNAQF
jgi:serine/threonine-protein kinase